LPPSYDPSKTYPVFFLTDGVWRFGDSPKLRKVMEDGEASDVIIVTLGYNYNINGADGVTRFGYLVPERAKLLDFITDNLMPYLGENYKIDYGASTLYGHSDGGVFAEYALFSSDTYENQPFGKYIIGSPAFWGLYSEPDAMDLKGYQNDYGYWDRNASLNKHVFLCGGSQEDSDYADKYNGNPTTLEGLEALKNDLTSHGADVTYKLYESHHYQYIPEMLVEYLKTAYPAK
jgi:predicted alpha/beta superfamily hydrolase